GACSRRLLDKHVGHREGAAWVSARGLLLEILSENTGLDLIRAFTRADGFHRRREIGNLALRKQADGTNPPQRVTGGGVHLDQSAGTVRAIPGPMHRVLGYAGKVPLLHQKGITLDEDPHFAFQKIVELFGVVAMWIGVVTRRANSDHHVAEIAVNHLGRHGATADLQNVLTFLNVITFHQQRHAYLLTIHMWTA